MNPNRCVLLVTALRECDQPLTLLNIDVLHVYVGPVKVFILLGGVSAARFFTNLIACTGLSHGLYCNRGLPPDCGLLVGMPHKRASPAERTA